MCLDLNVPLNSLGHAGENMPKIALLIIQSMSIFCLWAQHFHSQELP